MFLDSCMRRGKYIRPTPKFAFQCTRTRPVPVASWICAPKRRQNLVNALWLNCVKREQVKSWPKTAIGLGFGPRSQSPIGDCQTTSVRLHYHSNVGSALGTKSNALPREALPRLAYQRIWISDACRFASCMFCSVTTFCGSCVITTFDPTCWASLSTAATVANID